MKRTNGYQQMYQIIQSNLLIFMHLRPFERQLIGFFLGSIQLGVLLEGPENTGHAFGQLVGFQPFSAVVFTILMPCSSVPVIHSVVSLCACECANRTLSERVPGVTQAIVAP